MSRKKDDEHQERLLDHALAVQADPAAYPVIARLCAPLILKKYGAPAPEGQNSLFKRDG